MFSHLLFFQRCRIFRGILRGMVAGGVLLLTGQGLAQPAGNPWQSVAQLPQNRAAGDVWVRPERFRAAQVDPLQLREILSRAPREEELPAVNSEVEISLPMPDGTFARFRIVESPIMAPGLAAQFPEIKTYAGQGIDDPQATVRFDVTPAGFHAQILSPRGAVYIDPAFRGDNRLHASYYKRDYRRQADGFECLTPNGETVSLRTSGTELARSGGNLRTYRLACAATGEYTQFHGGTVSAGMAAIVTAINRVNGVYEAEVAVRFVLVTNNHLIVYTNGSTDPYNNSSGSTMLSQNQSNLDAVIGNANYDIGHVFSTGGGGIAGLGVVCVTGNKARGVTGLPSPIGDAFYIDYVAHEIGHQFGANHTFNSVTGNCGGGNRNASTAYEPGSGSTIMAYAGICGTDNLQTSSDPYFHSVSFDEIVNFTTLGSGNSCPVVTSTGNNAPTVSAGLNYTIPRSTPFILTASGSDPNGDGLTYCWEERDLGPGISLTTPDNGSSPLFRSFNPTTNAWRVFPKLSDILNNTTTPGEMLPTTSRTMNFRVTARDNRAGGGGVNTADMQVTVNASAGPFVVTAPNSSVTWSNVQTVTWNVAGTTASPISAANVDILLSTNGGLTFPIVLAANTPNDGAEPVLLPNITTSSARIKVQASGNIFFDISDANFSIIPSVPTPLVVLDAMQFVSGNCAPDNGVIDPGETVTVNVVLRNAGSANTTNVTATLLATNGVVSPSGLQTYGTLVAGGPAVTNSFTFTASGVCGGAITPALQLQDGPANLGQRQAVFTLGSSVEVTTAYTNATSISVPATGNKGKGSPFPSNISVSGTTGVVSKVTVTLRGITHTWIGDVDVLLVSPSGQKLMLMSDAGDGSSSGNSVNNVTLTFDDAAPVSLPSSGATTSGTYKPTNHNFAGDSDSFSSPAPAGPYGTALAIFNGGGANGTWSLYAEDDAVHDLGSIAQGWSLQITTSVAECCAGTTSFADLAIGKSVSPAITNLAGNFTFNLNVTNLGPNPAANVSVTDALPSGFNFVNASASQGSWTNDNGIVTFNPGSMNSGQTALLSILVQAVAAGTFTNTAGVSSLTDDPAGANNTASAVVTVNSPPAISSIDNQVTDEDTPTAAIAFTVSDLETSAAALSVSGVSSNTALVPNANLVFENFGSNRTLTITPAENQFGSAIIRVFVSDGLATSSTTFQLTVNPVNDAPVLSPISDRVVTEGALLTFTNVASDVDSGVLTFSLSNAPPGAQINATNGVFTWTPSEEQGPGTNTMGVVVTDDGSPALSALQSFTVIVLESNLPPVLSPVADLAVHAGTLVVVSNYATDADLPVNALTYALENGAEFGAEINATNGTFTWQTTEAFAHTTNEFTLRVTDDGVPALSDTQSFAVTVLPAPLLQNTLLTNGVLTISWSAIPGETYRVQFAEDLSAPVWSDLPPDVTATNYVASKTDTVFSNTNRFYRVLVAPGVP